MKFWLSNTCRPLPKKSVLPGTPALTPLGTGKRCFGKRVAGGGDDQKFVLPPEGVIALQYILVVGIVKMPKAADVRAIAGLGNPMRHRSGMGRKSSPPASFRNGRNAGESFWSDGDFRSFINGRFFRCRRRRRWLKRHRIGRRSRRRGGRRGRCIGGVGRVAGGRPAGNQQRVLIAGLVAFLRKADAGRTSPARHAPSKTR